MFDVGKEIVTFEYGDVAGFRDKLAWYVAHETHHKKAEAVAIRVAAINRSVCRLTPGSNMAVTRKPRVNGAITPMRDTRVDSRPTLRNSLTLVSSPTRNSIKIIP